MKYDDFFFLCVDMALVPILYWHTVHKKVFIVFVVIDTITDIRKNTLKSCSNLTSRTRGGSRLAWRGGKVWEVTFYGRQKCVKYAFVINVLLF